MAALKQKLVEQELELKTQLAKYEKDYQKGPSFVEYEEQAQRKSAEIKMKY